MSKPSDKAVNRRGSVARTRAILTANDPEYGAEFDEAEWSRITERIGALARLLCEIGQRIAAENENCGAADRSRWDGS